GLARQHVWGFSLAALVPILHVLAGEGRFYFLAGPYVLNHPSTTLDLITATVSDPARRREVGKKIVNDNFQIFGVNYYHILEEFRGQFTSRTMRRQFRLCLRKAWKTTLKGWALGYASPRGKLGRMFRLYWSFPEFWLVVPLFILPRFVTRFAYQM